MAEYSIVEDPRPARRRSNHPSHQHNLVKTDMRRKYLLWRCDLCKLEFNSRKSLQSINTDKEPDPTFAYHCDQCSFDVCTVCFKGYLHPFHHHRLKKAIVLLIYPETEGQWRCDACQKVFTELTAPTSHHCSQCEIDICDKCFTGSWKHVLHIKYHSLKPVDPRLTYRKYTSWLCDACDREFTTRDTETLFHCSVCQYDICSDCFRGIKHHLHQHPLCLVSKETHGGDCCTNCSKYIVESEYRKCTDPNCCFSLCGLCYLSPPKYHPYHREHPLALCDASTVYPQSAGMWHCDNCTRTNPYREQTALPTTQPMYHCDVCDYDLCENCYKRGLDEEEIQGSSMSSGSHRIQSHDSNGSLEHYMDTNGGTSAYVCGSYSMTLPNTCPPGSGLSTLQHSRPSPYQPTFPPSSHYGTAAMESLRSSLSSLRVSPSNSKRMESAPSSVNSYYYPGGEVSRPRPLGASLRHSLSLYGESSLDNMCMMCKTRKATKFFCHGASVMTCTAKAVVCDQCAGEVITGGKSCPACGRTPDGVSSISF